MPDKMINSPKFEVQLSGLDLTENQVRELESMFKETTMKFLGKLDSKGDLVKGALELKPALGYWPPYRPFPGYRPIFLNKGHIHADVLDFHFDLLPYK